MQRHETHGSIHPSSHIAKEESRHEWGWADWKSSGEREQAGAWPPLPAECDIRWRVQAVRAVGSTNVAMKHPRIALAELEQ